jgi:GNAT superfamily N-acetyltransferase
MSNKRFDEVSGEITAGLLAGGQFIKFAWLIPPGVLDLLKSREGDYIIIGAAFRGFPCGVLVATSSSNEEGDVKILYLCVGPDFRRRGVATKLFDELIRGLSLYDDKTKIFYPFTLTSKSPEKDSGCLLLTGMGFTITKSGGGIYRTTLGALEESSFWEQPISDTRPYIPISKLPKGALADFSKRIMHKFGMILPPFTKVNLLADLSHVIVSHGRIEGIAAVTKNAGVLEISWLYCPGEHIRYMPDLVRMVHREAIKTWPQETPLRIAAVAEASAKLAEKLCPESDFYPYYDAEASLAALITGAAEAKHKSDLMNESRYLLYWWKNITM